jgi:hypothetical protein
MLPVMTGVLDEEENGNGNIDNGVDEETVEHFRITIHWGLGCLKVKKAMCKYVEKEQKTLRKLSYVHTSFSCNM